MRHTFGTQILDHLNHLCEQKPSVLLAEPFFPNALAKVKQQTSVNILKHHIHKVPLDLPRWFHNLPL
jgi:hypothetical protein